MIFDVAAIFTKSQNLYPEIARVETQSKILPLSLVLYANMALVKKPLLFL